MQSDDSMWLLQASHTPANGSAKTAGPLKNTEERPQPRWCNSIWQAWAFPPLRYGGTASSSR